MVAWFLVSVGAIVVLRRAGVSAGWTVAILALLPVAALTGLAVTAPGYLPSLFAESSGRMAIASSVGMEILAALSLTWTIRRKV